MPTILKKYGKITEITKIEKEPLKIRLYAPRKKCDVHGARRQDNLRRTRDICVRRVSTALDELGCPLLVTLTFAGDASDASYANDSLRGFQVRLRAKYKGVESLFIPELSPKGRIHFHGLLFNVPLHFGDTLKGGRVVSHGTERKTRELAELWGEGYVDAKKTDGSGKLAYYISKYITKGSGHVIFNGMRLLRISRGFPRETVIRGWVAEEAERRYALKKPFKEWEHDNIFLGKISRKFYLKE